MSAKVLECDAETGKAIKEHPRPKPKWGWHLVSFSPDGKRYAAHFGFNVRIYDTATGFEPQQLDNQHEPGSSALPATVGKQLVWSPDGKQVAAVGVLVDVGKVGMAGWDVETGKRFYSFAADFTDGPRAVAFSSDSKAIAIGYEKRVDVWTGGLNPVKNLGEHGLVSALVFAPDGKTLAAGIRLPIFHGGDKVLRVIGHKTEVRLLDLTTDPDKVPKVFDGFEGVNHMATTKLPVTALAFSPDGKKLIAVTGIPLFTEVPKDAPKSGEVKVFDVPAQPEKPDPAPVAAEKWTDTAVLTDHGRLVNGGAVAPDGKSFAAATDGNVTCWNATTRKVLWTHKADAPFLSLAYSPEGKFLAVGHPNGVSLLDAATGKPISFPGRKGPIDRGPSRTNPYAVAFSPKGNLFVSAAYGCGIRVIDTATGADAAWPLLADEYLVVPPGPADPAPKPGVPAPRPAAGPPVPTALAFSPDGSKLAVATHQRGKEARVRLHDAKTGKILETLDGTATAGLAWSKDGKAIASGGQDGLVILWDATSGKVLWRHAFKGRDDTIGRVNSLAISSADNTVAVAVSLGSGKGADRVVLLAGSDGKDVDYLMRWSIPVSSVAWSADGKFLLTGCGAAGQAREQTEPAVGEVVVWERKP
jgi:WD40 repeat protein